MPKKKEKKRGRIIVDANLSQTTFQEHQFPKLPFCEPLLAKLQLNRDKSLVAF